MSALWRAALWLNIAGVIMVCSKISGSFCAESDDLYLVRFDVDLGAACFCFHSVLLPVVC